MISACHSERLAEIFLENVAENVIFIRKEYAVNNFINRKFEEFFTTYLFLNYNIGRAY
jgi:hypothetical protein